MVSILYLGDRDINREMVREGYAWAYREYLHGPYASEYIDAEKKSRFTRKTTRCAGLENRRAPFGPVSRTCVEK
jgi:endonuclease YncB( thermonuclease family)